ncbi:MAG: dihydrodipicolinate synthase/N-acetylneuraminate lyase [Saprospiraceae bacterium]|jgi:dihydrodipicolinate synthase/N-acetylneuraminate lyase
MKVNWTGVYPAVTTKFTASHKLDIPANVHNLKAQIAAGVDGIIIGGSLGEASTLTIDERQQLVEAALAIEAEGISIILNIAERRTSDAIALAQLAEKIGAHGLMLLPPMQYKADSRETVEMFKAVAANTSLPIMLYNNPHDYKIAVTIPMLEELASIENFKAIKESSRDITNIIRFKNAFGDRYKIHCGVDTLALECLAAGADGWVAGLVNAFPRETVVIFKLVKAGRIKEALEIYRWFMPLLELDIHPKLVQYIKLAEVATGLGTEYVRAPRLTLEGTEREEILNIINTGVANRPDLSKFDQL